MDDDPPRPARRRQTLDVRVSSTVGRLPLARPRVADIARQVLRGERCPSAIVAVTFVSAREIARLHRAHLHESGPTDIITLEHARAAAGAPLVGDIYIAPAVAAMNARDNGCTQREELARLTIHGVLHTLGWEHPEGPARTRSAMWRRQERWVSRLQRAGAW